MPSQSADTYVHTTRWVFFLFSSTSHSSDCLAVTYSAGHNCSVSSRSTPTLTRTVEARIRVHSTAQHNDAVHTTRKFRGHDTCPCCREVPSRHLHIYLHPQETSQFRLPRHVRSKCQHHSRLWPPFQARHIHHSRYPCLPQSNRDIRAHNRPILRQPQRHHARRRHESTLRHGDTLRRSSHPARRLLGLHGRNNKDTKY